MATSFHSWFKHSSREAVKDHAWRVRIWQGARAMRVRRYDAADLLGASPHKLARLCHIQLLCCPVHGQRKLGECNHSV